MTGRWENTRFSPPFEKKHYKGDSSLNEHDCENSNLTSTIDCHPTRGGRGNTTTKGGCGDRISSKRGSFLPLSVRGAHGEWSTTIVTKNLGHKSRCEQERDVKDTCSTTDMRCYNNGVTIWGSRCVKPCFSISVGTSSRPSLYPNEPFSSSVLCNYT